MVRTGKSLWRRHPAVRTGERLSLGERAADGLKHWFGTWLALGAVAATIAFWVVANKLGLRWDPYPYILLNLCLSCLAAVQGIVLQIAANRGDRINAEVALHTRDTADQLLEINHQQLTILTQLAHLNAEVDKIKAHIGCPEG